MSLLRELKTILEHEQRLGGPLVPIPHAVEQAAQAAPTGEPVLLETTRQPAARPAVHKAAPPENTNDGLSGKGGGGAPSENTNDGLSGKGGKAAPPENTNDGLSGEGSRGAPSENTNDGLSGEGSRGGPSENTNDGLFGEGSGDGPRRRDNPSPYARIHALIPADSPLQEMTALDDVEAFVRNTKLIPLDINRTNPVFGVGNPSADLMVIGEAPGADEDAQGEPFVGRAGQLLNKILKAIDFERQEVYIANILKSRPPNNRNPLAEEVQAHAPILYKQMALIRPKLLLCLGKVAASTLLDRQDSLGAMRQTFHDFHGLPLLVTYHPAALLRNPGWKRAAWEDVQMLRKRYDQLTGNAA